MATSYTFRNRAAKRGTTTKLNSYAGPWGELCVDTNTGTVVVQNGTNGGVRLARAQDTVTNISVSNGTATVTKGDGSTSTFSVGSSSSGTTSYTFNSPLSLSGTTVSVANASTTSAGVVQLSTSYSSSSTTTAATSSAVKSVYEVALAAQSSAATALESAVTEVDAIYVSTSGNDANTGTSSSPFRTIQKAIDTAKYRRPTDSSMYAHKAVIIYIGAGTYSEAVVFSGGQYAIGLQGNVTVKSIQLMNGASVEWGSSEGNGANTLTVSGQIDGSDGGINVTKNAYLWCYLPVKITNGALNAGYHGCFRNTYLTTVKYSAFAYNHGQIFLVGGLTAAAARAHTGGEVVLNGAVKLDNSGDLVSASPVYVNENALILIDADSLDLKASAATYCMYTMYGGTLQIRGTFTATLTKTAGSDAYDNFICASSGSRIVVSSETTSWVFKGGAKFVAVAAGNSLIQFYGAAAFTINATISSNPGYVSESASLCMYNTPRVSMNAKGTSTRKDDYSYTNLAVS